jgi:hypothetical protein
LQWSLFILGLYYLLDCHLWIFEFHSSHRLGFLTILYFSQLKWQEKAACEWWRLLTRLRDFRSGDPKDKVFAFLGMSPQDFEEMGIVPKYGDDQPAEPLYWKLAVAGLKKGHVEVLGVPRIALDEDSDAGGGLKRLKIPSWVPDWRWTKGTPYSLLQFEAVSQPQRPPYAASSTSQFPDPFEETSKSTDYPTELRLKGYVVARITHTTPRPWTIAIMPGRHTVHDQALVLQSTQAQIREWEAVIRPRSQKSIYLPTGENALEAMYKTLIADVPLVNHEPYIWAAINGFERRQRFLRFMALLGLLRYLWPWKLVVLVDRFLRFFGIKNPEWAFRTTVDSMGNRRGARLISIKDEEHKENEIEYYGLVPPLSKVGDYVVSFFFFLIPE